jgi:alpha/beta hydrolase fold
VPQILFVHGMNVGLSSREAFERRWFSALLANLQKHFPGAAWLPGQRDLSLLYWTDLLPPFAEWGRLSKGWGSEVDKLVADGVRVLLRLRAERTEFSASHVKQWKEASRRRIEQAVLYMDNVAGVQDGVMQRFTDLLGKDTRLVIGHSLGSVIAYQGLLRFPHRVSSLMTVGSPLGTPRLIYERLAPHDWPNVERWYNVSARADVWSVPTPKLNGLFRGQIHDDEVKHGVVYDLSTHRLDRYLEHPQVLQEIARAFA